MRALADSAKIKPTFRPKISAKSLLVSNFQMIKLIFKASPGAVILFALESFRNSVLIFFEHTWLINYVLECVEYKRPFENTLIAVGAIFLVIALTSILGSAVWHWLNPKARLKAKTALKNQLFYKARSVDLEQFDNPEYYNDFVMNVEKVDEIVERTFNLVQTLSSSIGGIVTTGVFFVAESPVAFIAVMAATVVNMFFVLKRNNWYYSKFTTARPFYRKADYTKRLFYLQDYAKEVRLNPDIKGEAFKVYDKSFDGLVDVLKFHDEKIVKLSLLSMFLQSVLLDIATLLILVFQASVLHIISYSTVIVMFNSMYRLRRDFNSTVVRFASSAECCMYFDKIKDFLKTETKIKSEKSLPVENKPCSLSIKNLSFRYNDKDGDILHDISLEIKPKEKIALVGYNGAGKTTLIKLIMRLYDPTGGTIKMDDVDIRDYDVEQYRHNIGVIFQDFNIYAASVKENVVMGPAENVADNLVKNSLKASGFENRLKKMKDGINTELTKEFDDDGVNLSGGENQKIAIARSFYKNASLIILDEPSSALDPIAEYNFNKYLLTAAADCTVIFISHRLSTTRGADKIYMLEQGRIVEKGSHDELLKGGGKYAKMWHAQADKYTV